MSGRRWTVGARVGVCLASVLLLSGCFELLLRDGEATPRPRDAAPEDGETEDAADATGRSDAGPREAGPRDAGAPDTGRDTGPEAGRDAGEFDRPDAEPPEPARCRTEPTIAPFNNPRLEARWSAEGLPFPTYGHVCDTPLVIDMDGVAAAVVEPEIVFVSYPPLRGHDDDTGIIRIWDPRTGVTESIPPDGSSDAPIVEATSTLAAADLDGDGIPEIVGIGSYSGTVAYRRDGTILWRTVHPSVEERGRMWQRSISGAPLITDVEGDGAPEVFVGRTLLDGRTGERRWTGEGAKGQNGVLGPIPCAADLDGDGVQELIAGPTAYRADGSIYWQADAVDGFCAVADLRPPAGPEVVHVASTYARILDGRTGEELWRVRVPGAGADPRGGAPTIADFDGDGRPEIGVANSDNYSVLDQDCTGTPLPSGCVGEGVRWMVDTDDDSSSATGSSVFDFNGDGAAEVVYNDQYWFRIYDGRDGSALFEARNSSRTRTENPVIADVDNDGDAEIVFPANSEAGFLARERLTDEGVEIWGDSEGRWVGARRVWNQHSYAISHITERGTVPTPIQQSWTVLNAYRQNMREGGDVLAVPDLWGPRGSFTCAPDGSAILEIVVWNWGLERAGAGVVVAFYEGDPFAGGRRLGEATTTTVLEPLGGNETVTFRLEPGSYRDGADIWVLYDDPDASSGHIAECLEDNNYGRIRAVTCR
ncbi:MAG: hypothetical protein IT379_24490 [Deltaproteobacteria bacterium]|nr:hypothetical protein [Deltaproteobacteria bacterium]